MGVSYSTDDGATFTEYAEFYKNFQFLAIGAASEDAIWAGSFSESKYSEGMWHYGDILISGNISSDKNYYCNGDDVIISDDSYGSPDSWTWDFGTDATPSTETGEGPHTVTYATEGAKNITLTVTKGTDEHIVNKTIYVANAIPNDASNITGDIEVKGGETHAYSVVDQENTQFIWSLPVKWSGSSTSNQINITFDSSGTGTISVTPSNGCGDANSSSLEITATPGTGIEDIENNAFEIYPNPSNGNFKVDLSAISDINDYTNIDIISIDGSVIFSRKGALNQNEYEFRVDRSGMYIVRVTTSSNQYSLPVIIK